MKSVRRQYLCAFCLTTLFFILGGCGGDFSSEIKNLGQKAKQLAREEAMARTETADVAAEMGFTWPVPKPAMTVAQIAEEVKAEVNGMLQKEYPEGWEQRLRKEVEEKYTMVKENEQVRFIVNGGEGPSPVAEGPFLGRDRRGRIKIGERTLHPDEFTKEDLAKLDEKVHFQVVETEFRQKRFLIRANREEKQKKLFAEMFPETLRQRGYTQVEGKWVPVHDLVKQTVAERIAEVARKLEPEKQNEVFTANGFALKDGEWKPTLKKKIIGK